MSKSDTSLDDIAEAISLLASNIDDRFEQVDQRFEQVDQRFEQMDQRFDAIDRELYKIHKEQRETREWLEKIDNRLTGVESDIKEIYDRIVVLEKKAPQLTLKDKRELERKLAALIKWAKLVSKQTGISLPKI